MPRIKGWKKIREDSHDIKWKNGNHSVIVSSELKNQLYYLTPYGRPKWEVWFRVKDKTKTIKTFKTKASALKFAHNYMKRHPNG